MADAQEIPTDLKYTSEHEWVRNLGTSVEIGITSYAADQLGDVVFVELPEVGARVKAGEPFGVVESVKSVSDLFAPVNGSVAEINQELPDAPELINDDCYGKGWIIRVTPDNPQDMEGLLSPSAYEDSLGE